MKTNVSLIILFFLCLLSSYSNSKELRFNWKLEQNGNSLLSGTTVTSTMTSHSDADTAGDHSSVLDDCTQSCNVCTVDDYVIYDIISSTLMVFDQNNPGYIMPSPFDTLLGNLQTGSCSIQHSFRTQYILRGQTTTAAYEAAKVFCCVFCFPIYLKFWAKKVPHRPYDELDRIRVLRAVIPKDLPEVVIVQKCSLFHRASSDSQIFSSPGTLVTDSKTKIFDLFLNTPETQKWIIEHLNPSTNQRLDLIIPQLSHTAVPAVILVREQNDVSNSGSRKPSHFITVNLTNGIKVEYHFNRVSDDGVPVLAIVASAHGYTLTLAVDNYDVMANQPPPHYAELDIIANQPPPQYSELTESCHCNGACNCAAPRENDTDNSDNQIHVISILNQHLFFSNSQ
ncbi:MULTISPECIES: hypothetical protein [unclassified Endozoicomonas]|uniref:hypothetical protein n=1 Tax=unclassified Endozoicomonas TaxID=2644528 RepID=UPI002148D1B7|nr:MULTISPECIES: hypothetical protein [unclassified Endozoicomonas]